MFKIIRFVSVLSTVAALLLPAGCMPEPVEVGAYPSSDEDVESLVTREQAIDIAEIQLEGLNAGDYEAWTTQWADSLREAIPASNWKKYREQFLDTYGSYESIVETRITAGDTEGFVRFSFLVEFEAGELTFVQVYPQDGDEIYGVHLAKPDGSDIY